MAPRVARGPNTRPQPSGAAAGQEAEPGFPLDPFGVLNSQARQEETQPHVDRDRGEPLCTQPSQPRPEPAPCAAIPGSNVHITATAAPRSPWNPPEAFFSQALLPHQTPAFPVLSTHPAAPAHSVHLPNPAHPAYVYEPLLFSPPPPWPPCRPPAPQRLQQSPLARKPGLGGARAASVSPPAGQLRRGSPRLSRPPLAWASTQRAGPSHHQGAFHSSSTGSTPLRKGPDLSPSRSGPPQAKDLPRLKAAVAVLRGSIEALFPTLHPLLPTWLLWQLMAQQGTAQRVGRLGADDQGTEDDSSKAATGGEWLTAGQLVLSPGRAGQTLRALSLLSHAELAGLCQLVLEGLRSEFLEGRSLEGGVLEVLVAAPHTRTPDTLLKPLGDSPINPADVAAAALHLVAAPAALTPQLPSPGGSSGGTAPLPPPPPQAPAAQLAADPPPGLRLFTEDSPQLRSLVAAALERWEATARLAHAVHDTAAQRSAGRSQQAADGLSSGGGCEVVVGPGVDFGLRQVTPASEQLQQVLGGGFGGKRGPPNGAHVEVAMEGGASLLDLLHLLTEGAGAAGEGARGAERGGEGGSAVAGQEGSGPVGSAQVGSRDGWPGVPAGAAPSLPAPPLLSFRSIEISNKSSSSVGGKGSGDLWVLGGLASPQLPHTFAVLDDGRLFVTEGHMAVRIPPGASHPLTAALSTTDGPHRTEECGLLKQLLLVVLAVPLPSPTAAHLASLGGAVPWEDVVGEVGGQGESGGGGEGGREGSLPPAGMRGWRVFVVGRQLTVGLVRRAGEVARLLDPEARPYVAESLRTLFNTPPPRFMGGRTAVHAQLTLEDPLPASQQLGLAVARWAAAVAGGGGAGQSRLERGEGDWLTAKYRRLLLLEEQAMEQGMGRYDMWYTRLRLAAVREDPKQPPGSGSFRYSEILDGDPRESGGGGSRRRGVYIGPLPPPHDAGGALRLMGMLDVPGLQEGRPTLVAGDTVYLRTAGDPYREIPAVLLLAQGSLCFLALPPLFWDSQDVRPLLEGVVGGTGRKAVGAAGGAWQGGLCHVRFSFDRRPLAMMHAALMVASAAMSAHDRRSTLPACRLLPPSPPQGDTSPSLHKAFSSGVECQPPTAWLAPAAEAFEERGGQRLNAEQRAAVAAVVGGGGRAAPFALFGPPGTGKTVTLVECALQLLAAHPACRLLLAAPQNYSADLLCSALAAAGVGPDTMCRLNDPRRPAPQVKADVVPYCWFSPETRLHVVPSPLILQRYAVVVCTCTAAGLLQGQTFTHVLVDEAGQALVPEALIPLALLHPPSPPAPTAPLTTSPVASAVSPTAAPPPPSLKQAAAARSIREATTSSTLHIEHVPHGSSSSSSSSSGVGGCGGSTPAPSKASAGDPGSPAEKFPPQWRAEVPQAWRHLAWPWDLLDREASTAHAEGGEYSCPRESQAPGDGGAAVSLGWGAVLCGDPQQLGPVVHSGTAAAVGLGVSLLEQWIRFHGSTSSLYEAQRVSPPLIQLVRNYRSHPRLLTLPSRLFYRGTLQAAAHPASVEAPAWQELRCVTPPPGTIPYATRGQGQSQEGTHTSAGFAPVHEQTADSASGSSNDSSHEQAAAPPHAHSALRGSAAGGSHGREGGWEGYGSDGGAAPPLANLLFWGVMGQQAREGEAPSFFNPMEASVVVELVQGLLGAGSGVGPDDIGVMATYRKQVQKVRLLLRERGLGAIRVGTVDDYQGQEERIIFITTVLSKPESLPPLHSATAMAVTTLQQSSTSAGGVGPMLGRDAVAGGAVEGAATEAGAAHAPTDLHLGFWRNPKRFNVAITRARAVLVVVGHPLVLLQDANWRELLSYCVGRGVYRGAGAGMIRERLGVGTNDGEPDHDDHDDPGGADGGAGGGEELRRFIREVADRALLGVGDADVMFPTTLDQMYEAYADDVPGRIML